MVVWPASAMLTGSGIGLILRDVGTSPGDHWTSRHWWLFSGAAALSLAGKYLIRWRGSHVFNPSNERPLGPSSPGACVLGRVRLIARRTGCRRTLHRRSVVADAGLRWAVLVDGRHVARAPHFRFLHDHRPEDGACGRSIETRVRRGGRLLQRAALGSADHRVRRQGSPRSSPCESGRTAAGC